MDKHPKRTELSDVPCQECGAQAKRKTPPLARKDPPRAASAVRPTSSTERAGDILRRSSFEPTACSEARDAKD